jgi:hypothetical protein
MFGKLIAMVGEPIAVRFVVPAGARVVRASTDRAAVLSASVPAALSPAPDRLEPPYAEVALATSLWRYARYDERGWLPLHPANVAALTPARTVAVAVQARLEPKITPFASEERATTLVPAGRPEKQTVIERVAAEDAARFLATWSDGHYTRVVPGQRVVVDLAALPTRPSIQYRARAREDDAVGARLKIAIGDTIVEESLATPRGTLRLPAGLGGWQALRFDVEPAGAVELLVDRPPAASAGSELYALRTVYRVSARTRVAFVINKRDHAAQNVNLVVYARAEADPSVAIRIAIDGGSPVRLAGKALTHWTLAERTLPLPPADRAPTLGFVGDRGGVLYARTLAFALGDDLAPGPHTVDVVVEAGAQTELWGRFFTLIDSGDAPRALQWRGTESEVSP